MQELVLDRNEAGQRLDKFLKKYLNGAPEAFIYRMLRKKNITLNGKKAQGRERTEEGDVVKLFLSDETIRRFRTEKAPAALPDGLIPEVLFEDSDILIVNKPAGLLSQPDSSGAPALTDWVRARAGEASPGRAFVPAPVNRLDRNTSGIVLCGVSLEGEQLLARMIREKLVRKEYLAVTAAGDLPRGDGLYRAYGSKDPRLNRLMLSDEKAPDRAELLTGIRTLAAGRFLSLREIELITGRPHQIRAHLAFLGIPVAGDPKYGDPALNRRLGTGYGVRRQLLHAFRVTFAEDPDGDEADAYSGRSFEAPVPDDMKQILEREHLYGEVLAEDLKGTGILHGRTDDSKK